MRRITLTFAFGALLVASAAFAQATPPPTTPPPATPPATGQKPTPPPIVPPPTAGQGVTPKPAATPVPFPPEAKIAFVDLQRVVNDSKLGKSGLEKMKALDDKLNGTLQAKAKEIQALQEKMKAQQSVASETVMTGWTRELDRLQREGQFMQQDAEVQRNQLQTELLESFQRAVLPIVEAIRNERGLWMIFQLGESAAIVAAHAGLDLTGDVTKRLDAGK